MTQLSDEQLRKAADKLAGADPLFPPDEPDTLVGVPSTVPPTWKGLIGTIQSIPPGWRGPVLVVLILTVASVIMGDSLASGWFSRVWSSVTGGAQ